MQNKGIKFAIIGAGNLISGSILLGFASLGNIVNGFIGGLILIFGIAGVASMVYSMFFAEGDRTDNEENPGDEESGTP